MFLYQNQKGVSLVQIIISIGLAGGIALGLLKTFEGAQKSQNTVMQNFESLQIIQQTEQILRAKQACINTFGDGVRNLADPVTDIRDRNGNSFFQVDETYSGTGAGGRVKILSMGFATDDAGVVEYTDISGGPFDYKKSDGSVVRAVTGAVDFEIVLSKETNVAAPNKTNSYGAREIRRRIRGFRVVTENDSRGNIIGCHAPQDMYVEAACDALRGRINPANGYCEDVDLNNLTLDKSGELRFNDCGSIVEGTGPGDKPGLVFSATSGTCIKSFFQGRGASDGTNAHLASNGALGVVDYIYSQAGLLRLKNQHTTIEGTGGAELTYKAGEGPGGRHYFSTGNLVVNQRLRIEGNHGSPSLFERDVHVQGEFRVQNSGSVFLMAALGDRLNMGGNNIQSVQNIQGNGTISGFGVIQTSDERLKKNFVEIESALDKVSKLNGYIFDWADEARQKLQGVQIGVKAQEIEKVFPELVRANEEGYLMVNYQGLVAPLIEAVKEQKDIVNKQQAEIDLLKKQMKSVLEQLKNR